VRLAHVPNFKVALKRQVPHVLGEPTLAREGNHAVRGTSVNDFIAMPTPFQFVAHAVVIGVLPAPPTTHAKCIENVALAIAIFLRNVVASASVNRSRTVASSTFIQFTHTIVVVVADAVPIKIRCTAASTNADGVEFFTQAIALPVRNRSAPALVHSPGTVAPATSVFDTDAVVHQIADTVFVCIF
jgi:hypothetical protein